MKYLPPGMRDRRDGDVSEPVRIAYVINSVEGGGAASPVPDIVGQMRHHGAEVKLFALTRRDGRGLPPIEAAGIDAMVRDGGERDHRAALGWLLHELRAFAPTHIWTSLTRATLLGQIAGAAMRRPVVSWQHAAFLKPANRRLLRLSQRASRLWIADSSVVCRLTAARLKVGPDRLLTWPIFRADPAAPQAQPWDGVSPLRIGSLGRLHPVKGYDVLIDALGLLEPLGVPIELSIAGDGAERDRLAAQARRVGLDNLRLVGFQPDPARFLASLHLYVQPSRSEGFCIAAHEAMQAGLPVIGASVGEMPETILAGRTGFVAAPGDAAALALALEMALRRPEQLAPLGAAARARVLELFGPDRYAEAAAAVIGRVARLR